MTSEKILVLDFADLKWVVIECVNCSAEVSFDIQANGADIPRDCPCCRKGEYDPMLQSNLETLRGLYNALTNGKRHRVKIRIQQSD